MLTFEQAIRETTARLQDAGSASAGLDASLLLMLATGKDRLHLYTHPYTELTPTEFACFEGYVSRREKGEPIAYITGEREFWGLSFAVKPGVLIPRPDSETLVATLIALVGDKNAEAKIAEIGVGSGALIISILKEFPHFIGYGVDSEPTPVVVTQQNAQKHGVENRLTVMQGSWCGPLPDGLNVIISNPPYIRRGEISTLMRDVRNYEPHTALDGGDDGLDAYRSLIPAAYGKLIAGGLLLLEIGHDQKGDVEALLEKDKWQSVHAFQDLAGHVRVLGAVRA
ncbi:MAG: peptide chain release factor N(5)-glutamine methyltransferase [Proteobacteria bacterium]|nr:peptide chain release factor N(5)-glutamine methyltransferase [Pseudomonadota bacterium]